MNDKFKTLKTSEIRPHWEKKAADLLEGRIVTIARYMEDDEVDDLGFSQRGLVLQLENPTDSEDKVLIWASSDDEGNDAGAIHTTDDDVHVLPVMRE